MEQANSTVQATVPTSADAPAPTPTDATPISDDLPLQPDQQLLSRIMLLNGRSVSPAATSNMKWKLPFISDHILNDGGCPVPFMAITESWLKSYISDAQISIKNYNSFRADRPKRTGGGCLLYVHSNLIVTNESSYSDNYNSLVMCSIDSMNAFVAVIYRPPDSSIESFRNLLAKLQEHMDTLTKDERTPDIYILGDFNLPGIDWEYCTQSQSEHSNSQGAGNTLLEFMDYNFLTQMIQEPTRGENTLDLVLTNKPQDVIESRITDTQLSDHKLIDLLLGFNPIKPTTITKEEVDPFSFRAVDYHRANFPAMNDLLSVVDWKQLSDLCKDHDDTDGSLFLELVRLTVLQITLIHAPPKEKKAGDPRSKKAREKYTMKRRRRKLNARISALKQNNPNSQSLPKLIEEVNVLTYDIRDLIMNNLNLQEAKAVSTIKSNPRYFYSYAKRFAKVKSSVAPLRDDQNILQTDPLKKAEILQSQYVKVFSDPTAADVDQCTSDIKPELDSTCFLETATFSSTDIIAAIKELDPYSATPDGDIPARVLLSCKEQIAIPLLMMWQESFNTGIIPPSLKMQYITPIYKKGDRTQAANYRPVSITSHLIKIFERVLRSRLVDHMEKNSLLTDKQHGFRKKRSCLTQLIDHVDHILKCLNSGDEVDVIYLDYAKAFDKVDHKILLAKLKCYGIRGKMFKWIEEFLTNRVQTVVVEGKKSTFRIVLSGVPQGTVLGPILFILYINDQIEALRSAKGSIFADDTKLAGRIGGENSGEHCHALLQEDLCNVIEWALLNNMELNESKFEVVNYTLNSSLLQRNLPFTAMLMQYQLPSGSTIDPTNVVRDLGVFLSDDCSWTPHINQMVKDGRKMASWVMSVFRDRSQFLMLTLYKALVRSKLEYCCPVWNPTKTGDIEAIESIQRNFTRRISSCKDLDYWQRLKKLKILSLQRRRERYTIIHVWKIANGLAPNDIKMEFKTHQRLGVKAVIPELNTKAQKSISTHYDNSFGVKAARIWNLIPREINEKTDLDSFKVSLGGFIGKFPDTPPTKGYTAMNRNSLLEWTCDKGFSVGGRT